MIAKLAGKADPYSMARNLLMNRIAGEIILSRSPGETMRKWRILFEISQSDLAKFMGLAPSVLSDYEKNRRKSPGTLFVKRFVTSLTELDERRGGEHIKRYSMLQKDFSSTIIDIAEFSRARTVKEVTQTVNGALLAASASQDLPIFGYTVVDAQNAIRVMDAADFLRLFGSNSVRALVFTGVTRGRSPMIAVKIYPIKPRMVIIHGPRNPKDVDKLAIDLAEQEKIPYVLSLKPDVDSLVNSLRSLVH